MTDTHTHSTDAQSLDTVFALLRDRRRRAALHVLAARTAPVALADLAAAVAAREAADADAVAEALHHVHLPKLADAGVVDYDEADRIAALARTEDVAPFLETVESGA